MKKIISLFQRNYDTDRLVRDEVVPGAEWVLAGEGTATRKWDGTCCMVRDGQLFKRYEVKRDKTPPPDFEPANAVDENTGKQQGWRPVGDGPEDRWFREAFSGREPDGTYELVGPKVQGNPEGFDSHKLVPHGKHPVAAPRTFDELREWFAGPGRDIEGVVWWHDDGRMVKIKAKDFGLRRQELLETIALSRSGWAGVDQNGMIVDRREHPEAVPIAKNSMFGVPEPNVSLQGSPEAQRKETP